MNVYNYNRAGFFTDVFLSQCRRLAKNNIILSQAGMYREDVRNAVASAMQRQQNYILIATLVFSAIAASFSLQNIPKGTPVFAAQLYTLCMATALFFELVSAVCAIAGNHLANDCQNQMLLNEVRLPIEALIRDTDAKAQQECVEAFEHQTAGRVFRAPFLSRARGQAPQPLEAESSEETEVGLDTSLHRPIDLEMMHAEREKFMQVFQDRAQEWNKLNQQSILFLGLGLSNLFQGWGFYFVAQSSEVGTHWNPAIQLLCVLADVCITWAHSQYLRVPLWAIIAEVILIVAGQALCATIIQLHVASATFISGCFLIRVLVNAWGTWGVVAIALESNRPSVSEAARDIDVEDGQPECSESSGSEQCRRKRQAPERNVWRHWCAFLFIGTSSLILPWLVGLAGSINHDVLVKDFPVETRKLQNFPNAPSAGSERYNSYHEPSSQNFKDIVSTIRHELGLEARLTLAEVIVEANRQLGIVQPNGSLAQQSRAIVKLISKASEE